MNATERKFQVIMKEWDNIQAGIHKSTDAKFMIRRWAITLFSALFALSVYQDRKTMLLIAIATTLLFWLIGRHAPNASKYGVQTGA